MNKFIRKALVFSVVISLGLIFCRAVRAETQLNIGSFPTNITAGQEFEISFEASGLEASRNYNIKGLGGENFTEVDTWNGDWFQQNAAWASMPVFESGLVGSTSGILKVRFDSETESGTKDFKIRIKKSDSNDSNIDSELVSISVEAIPPTPVSTPEPTRTPMPAPTPVKTPAPVLLPIKTPKSKTSEATPEVLGEVAVDQTMTPIATSTEKPEAKNKNKFPYAAIFLIILGLGLVAASVYFGFRQSKQTSEPETLL